MKIKIPGETLELSIVNANILMWKMLSAFWDFADKMMLPVGCVPWAI